MNNSDQESSVRLGTIQRILGVLGARHERLITLAEAKQGVICTGQQQVGFDYVPITSIKGTVERAHDFDKNFRPTQKHTRARWESVNRAFEQGIDLPPVKLLKYRKVYFVSDGHHRVSVARHRGTQWVDALVTELCFVPEA